MKTLKRFLFLFLLLLSVFSLHAQTKLPKYAVLKTEGGEAYLTSVNQLSEQGYRLIVAGKFTILRLEATPPDTYRYLRLEVKGGPAQFTNWVNEQGAHGYRWLARTGLLEKAPHPRNYEYRFAPHGGLGPSKGAQLSSLIEEGYRPLGIVYFFTPLAQTPRRCSSNTRWANQRTPRTCRPGARSRSPMPCASVT